MGRSNYKLTDEQKQILNDFADDIIKEIKREIYREDKCIDVYDSDGKLDRNKFTAIVWYIGDKLSSY
jgi:hypothetical protein